MQDWDEQPSSGRPDDQFPGARELAAVLSLLPVASLVLAADGSAVMVNEEWTQLSAAHWRASSRQGWLGMVEPLDREPLWRLLTEAVAAGKQGSADFRLARSGGGQWSRWWWRSAAPGQLVVCVTDLDHQAPGKVPDGWMADDPDPDGLIDVVTVLVHRLFGVGLVLESAAGLAHGPVVARLQDAVDELDAVIRDVRSAVFAPRFRPGTPDDEIW